MIIDSPYRQCYDSPMRREKTEQIEKLVTAVIETLHHLKAENRCLAKKIEALDRENEAILAQNHKALAELDKIRTLENSCRKMEKEKILIRSKVETLLEDLEKIDFI
ncbi:MAG: hypothetical protein ACE5E9_02100 [Nitrospinaceae bacterium]